ncbi:DUF2630 family protein [Peterkaempfera bronchialis]|uniref:DUF2630 family protein n=1 Tax=Peterkaempfera bronchialis TaxID=2126346 RepID=A0A345T3U9_9ACTN|nr:DUF2630 family protein [Peterkaempfera bronchialis]AXI80654.1 DUF2630 family protein [Peterkaempfera bronchialis]
MTASVSAGQDRRILDRIGDMVTAEKELRAQIAEGEADGDLARAQLAALETELDQCWDLLRQRRAKEEYDEDPGQARVRPASEVEDYLS